MTAAVVLCWGHVPSTSKGIADAGLVGFVVAQQSRRCEGNGRGAASTAPAAAIVVVVA
jgi:hypothetical protein